MDLLKNLFSFFQQADRLRFLVGLGALLLGGAGFISFHDVDYNWINSSIIIALAVGGLSLMIAGLLIKSRFAKWGVIDLRWFQGEQDMRTLLSKCKKEVTILKTWFPEDGEIAAGLENALRNQAKVRLILCHPKAAILGMRSKSAGVRHEQAADWINIGLDVVMQHASDDNFKGVGFYNAWPGCPVIWADGRIFMGFYFWGHTSPNQPWLEVEAGTQLSETLKHQQDTLWDKAQKIETLDGLRQWLANPPAPPGAEA